MIVGLGIDTVELDRIAHIYGKYGTTFSKKILHANEFTLLHETDPPAGETRIITFLASRFAVKEAAVKALGTGFSNGIGLQDIEVRSTPDGKPEVFFHGKALERKQGLLANRAHLSLTHSKESASAVVILEHVNETAR